MVKLELEITDIDYDTLIREVLPRVADKLQENGGSLAGLVNNPMATTLLQMAPTGLKDKMVAELINAGASRLESALEETAARNGIPGKIRNLRATAAGES